MLKIDQGSGKLLRVPRLGLRSQPLGSDFDLACVITANPEPFFDEIDERLFLIGANLGPDGNGPPALGAGRVDLLALDLNGRSVAFLVEKGHKPSCFARGLLCCEWLGGWRPQDFLEKLPEADAASLRKFLVAGTGQINRDQRLILVAEGHSNEILWAAQSLRKQCGIDITLLRATLATDAGSGEQYLWFRREFPADGAEWAALVRPQETGEARHLDLQESLPAERAAAPQIQARPAAAPASAPKEEALRTLAGGLAEYLSEAMAAVDGSAELALRETPRDAAARLRFEEISRVVERVGRLTDELRVYSGRGSRTIERIDLDSVAERVAESAGCLLLPNVEFRTEHTIDLPELEGEASQIARVVANLLDNAVEALPQQGGAVTLATGRFTADRPYLESCVTGCDLPEGDYLYVEVADSGFGMDDNLRARIFDPFFTTKAPGRGLGLSAVLGIVRNHRGALHLESKPSEGTVVRVLFPLTNQRAGGLREAQTPGIGAGRTVLVVEEQESLRTLACQTFEADGFQVLTASDGWDALEVFAKAADSIDVVVLDWMLPNMSAEEAFRALRRIRGDTLILVTGPFPEEEASRRFAGKKLTGYIRAPFERERLAGCVRRLLSGYSTPDGKKAG